MRMLADDVVMVGDGGGKGGAVRTPVEGSLQVARFLAGLGRLGEKQGVEMAITSVNGEPGALAYVPGGPVLSAMVVDIVDDKIAANPCGREPRQAATGDAPGIGVHLALRYSTLGSLEDGGSNVTGPSSSTDTEPASLRSRSSTPNHSTS